MVVLTTVETKRFNRAKRRILSDMREGVVPKTVRRFSKLHDYVDANMYLVVRGEGFNTRMIPSFNRVIGSLDTWLRNR